MVVCIGASDNIVSLATETRFAVIEMTISFSFGSVFCLYNDSEKVINEKYLTTLTR